MRNKKTLEAGFTLIELMIVVVILGIIASFAYSSYSKSVQKSRRAEGKALLLEAAVLQERRIADSGSYASTDMTQLGYTTVDSENGYYRLTGTATDGFTLIVAAQGGQSDDAQCATMSLNALGEKRSAPNTTDCW
jgi:type IV pilus assembly protein PilE